MSLTTRLQTIKENIESMTKINQTEILRIFQSHKVITNENNNGTFINLTELKSEQLGALEKYIEYVNTQQEQLATIELEQERIEQTFYTKK